MRIKFHKTLCTSFLGVLFAFSLSGCERPLVEIQGPDVEVVAPDLSKVQTSRLIDVVVSAQSFRSISRVEINGLPMTPDNDNLLWSRIVDLGRIVNPLQISVFDEGDVETSITEFAARISLASAIGTDLLVEGRGGHTATKFPSGEILVTGGSRTANGEAIASMEMSDVSGLTYTSLARQLSTARAGHTASYLPNGQVLILGGASRYDPASVAEMVSDVELFDFELDATDPIVVVGEPIRRAFHTASVRTSGSRILIDLVGGVGDIQYTPEPRFGIRADLRTFELRNDTLFALSPAIGPLLPEALTGHTQTQLTVTGGQFRPQRYIYAGSTPTESGVGFVLDFGSPVGIDIDTTATMNESRSQHAAIAINNGQVLYFGGKQLSGTEILNSIELYSEEADQFFTTPTQGTGLVRRFGHTATLLNDFRILLLGGFTETSNSIRHGEFISLSN